MPKVTTKPKAIVEALEPLIYVVRDQRVMLDADLARIYGTGTKQFNQALKRNIDRFPKDFAFQLTREELLNLKSQSAVSSEGSTTQINESVNRSQIVTGSQ